MENTISVINPKTDEAVKLPPPLNQGDDNSVSTCNLLLRGELAAVETYEKVIEKFGDPTFGGILRTGLADHMRACSLLREFVLEEDAAPKEDSGIWGALTRGIQSTANLFGASSAITTLLQGERLGKSAYEGALSSDSVDADFKLLIRDRLLPYVNEHIRRLESTREQIKGS
ncbi:MAG: DUF2383 domain-containing protein [Verrucomicrobiota bacterium]